MDLIEAVSITYAALWACHADSLKQEYPQSKTVRHQVRRAANVGQGSH